MMEGASVLVVEYDPVERSRISSVLEADGFDVLECPGPGAPDFTCLGGRGLTCPLAQDADVVVLDLRLASDELMVGTPGWILLTYYMDKGKSVVAISGDRDPVHPFADAKVAVLRRPPDARSLVKAVRTAAQRIEEPSLA